MKYHNSHLKHVKKIKEICSETLYALGNPAHTSLVEIQIKAIINQCNIILETKKMNNVCDHRRQFQSYEGEWCLDCKKRLTDFSKPLPKSKTAFKEIDLPSGFLGLGAATIGEIEDWMNEVGKKLYKITKTI